LPTTHSGVDPKADAHREEDLVGRLGLPEAVELDELATHRLGRLHRIPDMIGIVERRVPERHDAIADILVDRPLALGDDLGHRRQKTVHEMGQAYCVEFFRKARKAADVAEHDRHQPSLAAELEFFGMGGELGDKVRRHVMREGAADFALLRLGPQIAEQ